MNGASTSGSVNQPLLGIPEYAVAEVRHDHTSRRRNPLELIKERVGWSRNDVSPYRQLPRKIPIKLEPKAWFANERTFLAWISIAVGFAATSSILTSMTLTRGDLEPRTVLDEATVAGISMVLSPLAMLIVAYAYFMNRQRAHHMKHKLIGFYDERLGPIVMASLIMSVLTMVTVVAYYSYFTAPIL